MTDGRVNVITSHQGCSPRRNELCAMHKGHMIAHMLPPLRAGQVRAEDWSCHTESILWYDST